MCYRLVICSDTPLPLVEWHNASPAFNVENLDDRMTTVRTHFAFDHFAEIGAHNGCACGFVPDDHESPDEAILREATQSVLFRYLTQHASEGAAVELFLFWEGSDFDLKGKTNLALDAFDASEFPLEENILTTISN